MNAFGRGLVLALGMAALLSSAACGSSKTAADSQSAAHNVDLGIDEAARYDGLTVTLETLAAEESYPQRDGETTRATVSIRVRYQNNSDRDVPSSPTSWALELKDGARAQELTQTVFWRVAQKELPDRILEPGASVVGWVSFLARGTDVTKAVYAPPASVGDTDSATWRLSDTAAAKGSDARRAAASLEATFTTPDTWASPSDATTTDEWVAQQPVDATATADFWTQVPTILWTFEDGSQIFAEFVPTGWDDNGDGVDDRQAVLLRAYEVRDGP